MFVEVGFSDMPDSLEAGRAAATEAMLRANRHDPCDMVLLFATARHDAGLLREAVCSVVGPSAAIVGGGAVGVITNDRYGYSGDQVGLAVMWFDGMACELFVQGGLRGSEEDVGRELGKNLAAQGIGPASQMAVFYDAIDRSQSTPRLVLVSHLLNGLEKGLGFLPNLVGAGLQGDFILTPTFQWTGAGIDQHTVLALAFSDAVRMDHVIMNSCRPGTSYYTVTKAEGQTILEINGVPALKFMDDLFQGTLPVEQYPFFLLFGVNRGKRWGEFDEKSYASRLCLDIDKKRGGIVMFEPDMVAGTEFQVMYRSLELSYMLPKLDAIFAGLDGRKPVFALYIDCAGRAAGYGGIDIEDALVVQDATRGKVPLLGFYSGVEIASVGGNPRGLDWTGVFCLFSVPSRKEA